MLAEPDDVSPRLDFELLKDEKYAEFQNAVYRLDADGRTSSVVLATLEGRFDSVLTSRNGITVRSGNGYGYQGLATRRIILLKVAELSLLPRLR